MIKEYLKRFKSNLKEKTIIHFAIEIVIIFFIFGFVCPYLFSAKSDILVSLGGVLLFFTFTWLYFNIKYLYNTIIKKQEDKKE